MGANEVPLLHVLNKVDKMPDNRKIDKVKRLFINPVVISAEHHLMISDLRKRIIEKMESNFQTIEIKIPYGDGKVIANAQTGVKVLERFFQDDAVKLKIRGARPRIEQIIKSIN